MRVFSPAARSLFATALAALVLLVVSGCALTPQASGKDPSPGKSDDAVIEFSGQVVRVELEGGFFGLVSEDGRRFLPVGLPDEFRRDGLAVEVRGRRLPATVGYRMWAPRLEILGIRRR
jgi:hypothetical protein